MIITTRRRPVTRPERILPRPVNGLDLQPPHTLPRWATPESGTCAAIVTCHNYGRFLRQCLASLLAQTLPFDSIVVVDDASTDDTAAICREHPTIHYVRGEWRDFTSARRAGLAAIPRTRFFVFVDADNWLSPNFHAVTREAMRDPAVGVSYGTMRYHAEDGSRMDRPDLARDFDPQALRRSNYVDAGALVRTEAYVQAGELDWVEGPSDWLMWLGITRAGWRMKLEPDATLHYRRHPNSMSQSHRRLSIVLETNVEILRRGTVLSVVTLFSGRLPHLAWQERLWRTIPWPDRTLHIVAVDNSRDPEFHTRLREALAASGRNYTLVRDHNRAVRDLDARAFADSTHQRMAHNYALSEHLARLYARAREAMPAGTDLVWALEDDIEPPPDAVTHLAAGLYRFQKAGVICGAVVSRYAGKLLAWRGDWKHEPDVPLGMRHLARPPAQGQYERVTGSGFMCSLFRRDVWDSIVFRPSPMWGTGCPYYDWAAAQSVQQAGWDWMISGSVRCRHWQSDGTWLDVPDGTMNATP